MATVCLVPLNNSPIQTGDLLLSETKLDINTGNLLAATAKQDIVTGALLSASAKADISTGILMPSRPVVGLTPLGDC